MGLSHRPSGSHFQPSALSVTLRTVALLALGAWGSLGQVAAARASAAEVPVAKSIQAPYYGEVLFHFWQDDDFTALATLMAAKQAGRIGPHDDDAEALRGRMLMNLGMHRDAAEALAKQADRGATPQARDQAWFDLAKMRYQRGQFGQAEEALARVQRPLPGAQEEERGMLQAQLLMARSDFRGAVRVLKGLVEKTPNDRFARYNLGVAQIKAGDAPEGSATLDALGNEVADTDEGRALRDHTNVALGFAALTAQQPAVAKKFLERVPLQGPESNKALLGYGWAALDQQVPQSALVPWLTLSKRDANDPAVLEAKVAVPYAYERLRANGKALQQYNEAIQSFERERLNLDASIDFVRSGRLVDSLLTQNPRSESGEGWHLDALPDVPHTTYLTTLLAQNAFQAAYQNLRDTRRLEQNLQAWRDKLEFFKSEQAARRQALVSRKSRVSALGGEPMAALRQRVESLEAEVARAASQDGTAFANDKQREQQARVARVQAIANKPSNAPDMVRARERLRLVSGLLNWQLAQEQAARLQATQQSLDSAKTDLAQAQAHAAAAAKTLREQAQQLDRFDERIQALTAQVDATQPKVAALAAEQRAVMQDMAVAELARQKANLATYLVQARFAVAQLYDQAAANARAQSGNTSRSTGNKEAADAPKP